ncbi:MAG: hypothetical protein OXF51_05375 [Alphaproteobacteria bacterium]|nr:hypothetical protein [Alphaproteobacteria bacterium]
MPLIETHRQLVYLLVQRQLAASGRATGSSGRPHPVFVKSLYSFYTS